MSMKLVIFSVNQDVINTPDILLLGYGREALHNQFDGGTLFHGAVTSLIWAENQVSIGAGETLMAKEHFEPWLWDFALLRHATFIVTIEFSILNFLLNIARTSSRPRHFLEFTIIMPLLNSQFKPSCTWPGPYHRSKKSTLYI